ncbi:MAG: cyclic pyranopterin monophosphate synthase MoaC [Thermoplasmata archaeon]|nr:cyclic pyranopterin monophosphate synthase MoaC [Thermoplasmata archaeon]
MIDISEKRDVSRRARARGEITLNASTVDAIRESRIKKGDVLSTAKVAGIQAVKDTPKILPLCHPIPITSVDVSLRLEKEKVVCECDVKAEYKTGVEMEALVGVTSALLTVWDMVKYLEKDDNGQYPGTRIDCIRVVEKEKGGE